MIYRADQLLVRCGLAASRTEAQRLIEAKQVVLRTDGGRRPVLKPSARLAEDSQFELTGESRRFASRGALKLQAALERFQILPAGRLCLDAGQSTGGFTDQLLAAGARAVVGIDVGHKQLVARLRLDARVLCVEKFNIRHATPTAVADQLAIVDSAMPPEQRGETIDQCLGQGFELIVADLSFISIRKTLPALNGLLAGDGQLVALVKPQFELGPGAVNRRGIVRNKDVSEKLQDVIASDAPASGLSLSQWIPSPIRGGDGNQEYLALLEPTASRQIPSK